MQDGKISSRRRLKWARNFGPLVAAPALALAITAVIMFGTWDGSRLPTLREAFGLLTLIVLFSYLFIFALIKILPSKHWLQKQVDKLSIIEQFSLAPLCLVAVDWGLLRWTLLSTIVTTANQFRGVLSLVLSGLLVILYYDQHRTQRRQLDLLSNQVQIEEKRMNWREHQENPKIEVLNKELIGPSESSNILEKKQLDALKAISQDLSNNRGLDQGLVTMSLVNEGRSIARDLELRAEVLVRSDELPHAYHPTDPLIMIWPSNLLEIEEGMIDQYFNREDLDLHPGMSAIVVSNLSLIGMIGSSEDSTRGLSKAIQELPFSVDDVVLQLKLVYQNAGGESLEKPVSAVRYAPEELKEFASSFDDEHRIGFDIVRKQDPGDSMDLFLEKYGTVEKEVDGVTEFRFD